MRGLTASVELTEDFKDCLRGNFSRWHWICETFIELFSAKRLNQCLLLWPSNDSIKAYQKPVIWYSNFPLFKFQIQREPLNQNRNLSQANLETNTTNNTLLTFCFSYRLLLISMNLKTIDSISDCLRSEAVRRFLCWSDSRETILWIFFPCFW